jgi:hypothetical protein
LPRHAERELGYTRRPGPIHRVPSHDGVLLLDSLSVAVTDR